MTDIPWIFTKACMRPGCKPFLFHFLIQFTLSAGNNPMPQNDQ
jgi:hypothetical protein